MKAPLVAFGVACCMTVLAPAPAAGQNDSEAVVAIVERFFEGMRTKDSTQLRGTIDGLARLILITPQGEARALPLEDFIRRVTTGPQVIDEAIFEPEVRVDGAMATVWASYDVLVDGTFSHCGFDAFQLSKLAGGWKITQVSDSRQRSDCTTPRAPKEP